jgi:hypothetical protein
MPEFWRGFIRPTLFPLPIGGYRCNSDVDAVRRGSVVIAAIGVVMLVSIVRKTRSVIDFAIERRRVDCLRKP